MEFYLGVLMVGVVFSFGWHIGQFIFDAITTTVMGVDDDE